MKNKNGITLISLVVTIIVLLILAGVAISTLTGDNGLLQKTTTAKEENEKAKELELIKLAVSAAQIAGEGTITIDNLNEELQKNFNNDKTLTEDAGFYVYKASTNYRIYKDGNVEEYNLLPAEYQQLEYIESTGTQWINTNVVNSILDYKFIFDCNFLCNYNEYNKTLIGDGVGDGIENHKSTFILGGSGNGYYSMTYNRSEAYNVNKYLIRNIKTENEAIIAPKKQQWIVENEITVSSSKTDIIQQNNPILIFRGNNTNYLGYANPIKAQIFKMQIYIYSIDKMVRNFIPCKSVTPVINADGILVPKNTKGLYDLVEGKFYTNKNDNGEDFIPGPEV